MKIYTLTRKQFLPISLHEAWDFFSSPTNLIKITPAHMGFKIVYKSPGSVYAGQVIRYKIKILQLFKADWMTEITHVNEPFYFVDEQRFGPYALWHHQHHFREVSGGIEMTDEVNYAIPFGFIGRIAHALFVERELNAIFEYRYKTLEKHFNSKAALKFT